MLLKKPIASIILVLAVLIFGGIALERLSIELMPDIARPTLLVRTSYTGAPASEVEFRVTEPLESVLSSVRGVKEVTALSRQGQSLLFLRFSWGFDMDIAFLNVREKLDQARTVIPSQAGRPQLLYSSASDQPIATIALKLNSADNSNFENRLALKRWAEQVFTRRLEQQEGIARAVLVGAVEPEVQIRFKPSRINKYGLSIGDIQQKVQDANIFSAPGELRDGWYRYSLKIESRLESMEQIRNIPVVSLAGGRVLRLHELAEVVMAEADPTSFALLDGQEVLNVLVKKEYAANTVEVFNTLQATLGEIRVQQPDISMEVIEEDATYIENSIFNLLQTLLVGGLLAFLVLFLFLDDLRSPFTIGISIPVSIFLTFVAMYFFDIQLNIISLSGLTLGIGLLLDNAIVVLENINRYRRQGLGKLEAAREGTREISLAVTASTFTTISVFLPLIFLGGFEGAFFRDLAATLSFSLIASLLVALFILPVFVARLSGSSGQNRLLGWISARLEQLIQRYEQSLTGVIRRPVLVIAGALLLIAAAGWVFMYTPKEVLPGGEPERVEYLVSLPGNTALRSSAGAARELSGLVREELNLHSVLTYGGYTDNSHMESITREGLNKFVISVPVQSFAQAGAVHRLMDEVSQTYNRWNITRAGDAAINPVAASEEAPVQFSIVGTDRAYSKRVAQAFEKQLMAAGSLTEKYPQKIEAYRLKFHTSRLLAYDLSQSQVIRYLESLTRGAFISDWNRQDEQIAIRMIGGDTRRLNPEEITLDLNDRRIPLTYLADISFVQEPEQLERRAQSPILTYQSSLTFLDWWWKGEEITQQVNAFMQQTGVEIKIGGAALQVMDLLEDLAVLLLISVLLIYLILAIQYENLKYPFIIILAIPFAWVGSVFALQLGGVSLNALSFMGVLILTGIAVNDAILKVDFMRRYYEQTGKLDESIRQAGIHRFRPVVMTSLTTILALIPMLIPFGDGYIFRKSLAIALMGGMISSTLLTLYVIPMVFRLVESRKKEPNPTQTS